MNTLTATRPLDVVTSCLRRDLHILGLACKNISRFIPVKELHVITARRNFDCFAQVLGPEAVLLDEDRMIDGMTLQSLKTIPLARFSQGPGWYFQQLLKYQFTFHKPEDDYFLIWDADTIPLRKLEFFDGQGRMLLTKAEEYHPPYFQTYEKLLGQPARREFSFIAQHMVVQKSILREMLGDIERHCPGTGNWAWKIMRNLGGEGSNRFSEYETYGHYIKGKYPHLVSFRELPWSRRGASRFGRNPPEDVLGRLGETYSYVSFEDSESLYRRTGRKVRNWLRRLNRRFR